MEDDPKSRDRKALHLYRLKEALDRLRISKAKIYDLVEKGELSIVKIGAGSRVRSDVLDFYIHNLAQSNRRNRSDCT